MEGAGNESVFGHTAVSETADGDLGLAVDVARLLFYGVLLYPLVGCNVSYPVVGGAPLGSMVHLPDTR